MIDSRYREKYQALVIAPLLKASWIQKLRPETLTFCAFFFGLLPPFFLFFSFPFMAFCTLVFSGFFDTLDGSLARFQKTTSDKGALLDITSDRCIEFAIILGLFLVAPAERGLHCLLMMGSILICITTFLVVGIFSNNETKKSFYYSPGIIERAEAFAFFAAMILLPTFFFFIASLFSILVLFTALFRIYQFLRLGL